MYVPSPGSVFGTYPTILSFFPTYLPTYQPPSQGAGVPNKKARLGTYAKDRNG